jgi:histone H3/H4
MKNIEEMVEIRAGAPDPRFVRYVRRIVHDAGHYDVRFHSSAIEILQEASRVFLASLFEQ